MRVGAKDHLLEQPADATDAVPTSEPHFAQAAIVAMTVSPAATNRHGLQLILGGDPPRHYDLRHRPLRLSRRAIEFLRTEIGVEAVLSRTDPTILLLACSPQNLGAVATKSLQCPSERWGADLHDTRPGAMTGQADHGSCQKDTGLLPPASKQTSDRRITERFW